MTNQKRFFTRVRVIADSALIVAVLFIAAATSGEAQTVSVLYDFSANPRNPQSPGFMVQGRDGNLYSTTPWGGTYDVGTVFKITPAGTLTVLYSFDGRHGKLPTSGLTLGTDGNFYGTTNTGGTQNCGSGYCGTVFKISPAGWLTVLHNFAVSDGIDPRCAPVEGTDRNFYGTTGEGGAQSDGTLYKITPSGQLTTLYNFDGTHGSYPYACPILATDGNLYGTTYAGGANGYGVLYKFTPAGQLTVLHNFDGVNGATPNAELLQGSDGNFYGATSYGGTNNDGVIFQLTATGTFTVVQDLKQPHCFELFYPGLVQATDGNFYSAWDGGGTAGWGFIYEINQGSSSILYSFDYTTGACPVTTPLQHTNGTVYGETFWGGSIGTGTIYTLDVGLEPFARLLPGLGKIGKSIGILGQGLTETTGVSFSGVPASFAVTSDTYLTTTVPAGATTGAVTVTTAAGMLTSNKPFRVTPTILNFLPTSGPVGTTVVLTGASLTQTTNVSFGGVAASFTVDSDTQVTATVPAGAVTGSIRVVTPGGFVPTSGVFTVTQ